MYHNSILRYFFLEDFLKTLKSRSALQFENFTLIQPEISKKCQKKFLDKFLLKFFISQNSISFIFEFTSKDQPGLTFALTSVTAAILKQGHSLY